MAYTTGTASSHIDLMDKLRLWATGTLGWTQLDWIAPAGLTTAGYLQLRGPGAGVGRQVFINIRSGGNATTGTYYLGIRGATAYSAGATWGTNPGEGPEVYFNLWDSSTPYWFFGNDRRIVVVAKASTNYMSAHMGFILPWGTPAQYPAPLMIAADYYTPTIWSTNNSGRRMFVDPGRQTTGSGSGFVRSPSGQWLTGGNHELSASADYGHNTQPGEPTYNVWPWHCGESYASTSYRDWASYYSGSSGGAALDSFQPTNQNERFIFPGMVVCGNQPPLGALDGIYCIPGGGSISTEQIITVGARNFQIFQNIQRNSGNDFFAVEQI
jgi:hypothetical protein